MQIQESCNDSHLVSISLTEKDIEKILEKLSDSNKTTL